MGEAINYFYLTLEIWINFVYVITKYIPHTKPSAKKKTKKAFIFKSVSFPKKLFKGDMKFSRNNGNFLNTSAPKNTMHATLFKLPFK